MITWKDVLDQKDSTLTKDLNSRSLILKSLMTTVFDPDNAEMTIEQLGSLIYRDKMYKEPVIIVTESELNDIIEVMLDSKNNDNLETPMG